MKGKIERIMGKFLEALKSFEISYDLAKSLYNENNFNLVPILVCLGKVNKNLKRLPEALHFLEKAREI